MIQRLLILDDSYDLGTIEPDELVDTTDLLVLCWVAPDTLERLVGAGGPTIHKLLDIVGGHRRWEEKASGLVRAICNEGPTHHGRSWRKFLAEPLFGEARAVQAILDTCQVCHDRVREGGEHEIHLAVRSDSERIFRALTVGSALEPMIHSPAPSHPATHIRPSFPQRIIRRLRQAHLSRNWRAQAINLATQADLDFRYRIRASRWLPTPKTPTRGGVTFFSSYLNNSRTLKVLEPYFPQDVTWVVTNSHARKGARDNHSIIHDLWRFAPRKLPAWAVSTRDQGSSTSASSSLDESQAQALKAWLQQSPAWQYWRDAGLTTLLHLTACWEAYLEQAKPRLVVIASHWGIEGWLARIAQQRGAAVVELLHGVLGGPFYTEGPLTADALIVWGSFWRQQRPEHQRSKIHVFNPGVTAERRNARLVPKRPRIVYFSWPFDRIPFYNSGELLDGFIKLFHAVLESQPCELTIRGHPLENLTDFTQGWHQRFGSLPENLHLSQVEPLSEMLEQTDIAIMFRSTVLLDCLACNIPVLIPGWIDFDWNQSLEQIPGIRLATDFADLTQTLRAWLDSPPCPDRQRSHHFLQPAGEGEQTFRELLAELSTPRPDQIDAARDTGSSTSATCAH